MNRIKELREQNNMAQVELAEKLRIGRSTISQYETGSRGLDVEVAKQIADLFGVSLDYVYGYTPKHESAIPGEDFSNRLFAAYGYTPPHLSEDAMDDVAKYLRFVAEQEKKKNDNKK